MAGTIRTLVRQLIRLAVLWIVDALSIAAAAQFVIGLDISAVGNTPVWVVAVAAALLLAVVNLLIRPMVLLIALPLGWIATLVVGFLVNSLALWTTAWLLPGFEVGFFAGLIGGIVIALFNTIITGILEIDEEGSWYQNRIERRARLSSSPYADEPGVGLLMVEIDGLSYWHIRKAMEDGLMPTLQSMVDDEGYELSLTDCGLPSMTSACQAGIMFGDNYDIPAYRWYDKAKQKLYVSADDATELNNRYAHGQGLMRHGSSIMNMMNGDADKSLFTMANMFEASDEDKKQRARDIALLMLNPYFLMRALALFIVELIRELWEAYQQKRKDVQPRLDRSKGGYPFVRAAMCSLMRDISANLAILDMMRGIPSIYMLYLGYDEVAHHSGPWTTDAFGDLKRLDKTIARLRHVLKEKAPRAYDFIILSDHGQSFGATFEQRYGLSIKEFIEQQLPEGTTVSQQIGGDTGAYGLQSAAGELANVRQSDAGNALSRAMADFGQNLAERSVVSNGPGQVIENASVTAYGSGNAAQVYFDIYPRKILLSELNTAFPGLVETVVQHEGIGLVVGYEDDGTALAIGKNGSHNLHTGAVNGEDPLGLYTPSSGPGASDIETRAWQLRRVMDFPSAGDLWVISNVYPDGTVAALEELVGSHGGVGGEQTDAFVLHPPTMEVPATRNSTDVFHILNTHRGTPVQEAHKPTQKSESEAADWSLSVLGGGLAQVSTWLNYAIRAILLDRSSYEAVAREPYMTGPALLIALVTLTGASFARSNTINVNQWLADVGIWLLAVLIVTAAGRLLTRKGRFVKTLRAMGFAQSIYVIGLLGFIPGFGPFAQTLVMVFGFLAWWMAAAAAHETRGLRTLFLPFAMFIVVIVGSAIVRVLLAGAAFSLQSVLAAAGLA